LGQFIINTFQRKPHASYNHGSSCH
jgi:hypothetical protein